MTFLEFMKEDLASARSSAMERSKQNMSSEKQKAQDFNATSKDKQSSKLASDEANKQKITIGGRSQSDIESEIADRNLNNKVRQAVSDKLKERGIREAKSLDPSLAGAASIRKTGDDGRKYPTRKKSEGERKRMKAVGGGKMAPVASYKDRKDIGATKARSDVEQQPTKERGSAADAQKAAAKAERKKAALARIAARKGGGEVKKTTTTSKGAEKAATQLLKKKTTKSVSPKYTPQKASGMTRAERDKKRGEGERYLKSIMKDQETAKYKKETGSNPDAKGRTKILGRVNKRMRS